LVEWSFRSRLVKEPVSWSWAEFNALRRATDGRHQLRDQVTKLDMRWRGVSVDTLLEHVELDRNAAL
jgi:hypothetical protein